MSAEGLAAAVGEAYPALADAARGRLARLKRLSVPAGTVLFRPGDAAQGFVLVLNGRIGVYLTGAGGREILLYEVGSGASCIQTTLGLLGGEAYRGEAVAETPLDMVLLPADDFAGLMDESAMFRRFVFEAFGARMADVTRVLEQVAFVRVEARLAACLLRLAGPQGDVRATHQAIATMIGSVREVVSRRLETFAGRNLVTLDRGVIMLRDRTGLTRVAAQE